MDTRISKLAYTLVHYSTRIEKGEKVLISYNGSSCKPLVKEIIREVYRSGAYPYVEVVDNNLITRQKNRKRCTAQNEMILTFSFAHLFPLLS